MSRAETRPSLRELYLRYGCCMAYIAIRRDGVESIGSAFHIGEGVMVTARHVVDGAEIQQVCLTDTRLFYRSDLYPKTESGGYRVGPDAPRITTNYDGFVNVVAGPFFHPNELVDVAAFKVEGIAKDAHFVPLGGHLDEYVGQGDFVLSEVLVMGYPPIPMTISPLLMATRGEVSAVADLKLGKEFQMTFLISTMPRGGYSGGLAYSEWGFALGLVTHSLVYNGNPPELGHATVASVQAIYECLDTHGVLPASQRAIWDDGD